MLVDTREQNPLEFSHPYITEIVKTTLPVGDYSVQYADGFSPLIFFERKSIEDLFSTLTSGHERFKREIEKAKSLNIKLILIIEGHLSKILKGSSHSTVEGIKIFRILLSLWIKHNLSFVLCKDREECSQFITEYFFAIGRLKGKKNK